MSFDWVRVAEIVLAIIIADTLLSVFRRFQGGQEL